MKAVLYIRVSTRDQATRADEPEGFSIPAQREACRRKAEALGATIVGEYVDRGESARSADRPALQKLLGDLSFRKDITYIIVHKVDRLARNLHDDVMIGLVIQKAGATLVSVTENIDETPSGRLLHGIMATIAEFYSRNLAAEALKGATQKAKRGGTPYRAPLGYINKTDIINEREARTVVVDIERARHIKWIFHSYASGNYTLDTITKELYRRGFRKRRTGRSVSRAVTKAGVANILHNRYYIGYVKYRGVEYRGKHKPLVSAAIFANVQAVLQSRSLGDRKRKHDHYLLRTLCCGRCGRYLGYTVSTGRGGRYHYFYCSSRQQGRICDQSYLPVALVEEAVAGQFRSIRKDLIDKDALYKEVDAQLRYEIESSRSEIKYQERRLTRLLSERQRILEAFYAEEIEGKLLRSEERRIGKEVKELKDVIAEATRANDIASKSYKAALEMATSLNFEESYRRSSLELRRYFATALYAKICVNDVYAVGISDGRKQHNITVTSVERKSVIDYGQLAQAVIGLTGMVVPSE